MKEIRDIVAAYAPIRAAGRPAVLATVICVQGSSYRQAGARMLIAEDGCMTGAISGGCLEGDALRKARLVMERNERRLVRYDSSDEDDAQMGLGLGCNGIIDVLLEPLDPCAANAVSLLEAACGNREPQVIAIHVAASDSAASRGTSLLVGLSGGIVRQGASQDCAAPAMEVLAAGESRLIRREQELLFCELIEPELRLLILGAGNDAVPLVRLAAVLGWETEVIDGRPAYASGARFPGAGRLRILSKEKLAALASQDARTVAVLMSHNYNYDLAGLAALLRADLPYIGVLGPRRRLRRMLDELGMEPEQAPDNIYGPTGLDIGASTPEEIALSVLAEIRMVLSGRSGAALRERTEPIHAS